MIAASAERVERLDVRAPHELRIRHDRRRVRVDEHDVVAERRQRLGALRARVVELAGLPDDDRPRADEQNLLDVVRGAASGVRALTTAGSEISRGSLARESIDSRRRPAERFASRRRTGSRIDLSGGSALRIQRCRRRGRLATLDECARSVIRPAPAPSCHRVPRLSEAR